MQAGVHRFGLADPGDVSELRDAIRSGAIDPREVVAVIGKTHGNGLVNDYTRGFLAFSLADLLASATGSTREDVTARVPFVFSGGVEGVLSPHYTVLTVGTARENAEAGPALAIGVAMSERLDIAALGRRRQIEATAAAVRKAVAQAGIERSTDVHLVQVKGPAPTLQQIVAAEAAGTPCRVNDPDRLMAYGRAASALGVALALGEIEESAVHEGALLADRTLLSSAASVSAGTEVTANEVVVLGMSRHWSGPLAIARRMMRDAIDLPAIVAVLRDLHFDPDPALRPEESRRLKAVLVKCEPQRDGTVRGRPHTMLNDGDLNAQRHIRGAVGGLVAGVLGETQIFVSGGAEHQGPDGGGLIAVIAERS